MKKTLSNVAYVVEEDVLACAELERLYLELPRLEKMVDFEDKAFLVRFVLGTGLRVGELAALRVIDCAEDRVWVRRSAKNSTTTKANGVRVVKIMPELLPLYQKRILEFRTGERQGEYFLTDVTDRTLMRWWQIALEECGVRVVSIHKGRHTYATHELQSGRLTLAQLKSQLGHTPDSRTTERYYMHPIADYIYPIGGAVAWRRIALSGRRPEMVEGEFFFPMLEKFTIPAS